MHAKIKLLDKQAVVPKYQSSGASGFDLHALETTKIHGGQTRLIRTGIAIELPEFQGDNNYLYELQIRPRGSMSYKTPIRIANSPGTVDNDYRGEIMAICHNTGAEAVTITAGERFAQAVICIVARLPIEVVSELSETTRGEGRLGSTGT